MRSSSKNVKKKLTLLEKPENKSNFWTSEVQKKSDIVISCFEDENDYTPFYEENKNDDFLNENDESIDPELRKLIPQLKEFTFVTDIDIPEEIIGEYSCHYNIFHIHKIIISKFEKDKKVKIPMLREKIEKINEKLKTPQTILTIKCSKNEIESIERKIKGLLTNEFRNDYLLKVADILLKFQKVEHLGINRKVNLIDTSDKDPNDPFGFSEDIIEKIRIIEEYIEIAKKYIRIDIVRKSSSEMRCINCGELIQEEYHIPSEDIMQKCNNCDTEILTLSTHRNSKENNKVTINFSLKEDKSIENFMKAFMKYQGLHEEKPPESLYDELEKHFISLGLPTGSDVKKLPLNKRKRRGNTTHRTIHTALGALGGIYTKYYEDTNYIGHIYFGWELPNFIDLLELCIEIYNETQTLYYEIPIEDRDRDSSLGTQFRLFKTLQLVGYECYEDEFKIADNLDSKRNHYRLWKMICDKSTNPSIYYIDL